MKKMMAAIAILSLTLASPVVGFGQGKAKAKQAPPTRGGQICTGCCDPCYSDDWWKVRNSQTVTGSTTQPNPQARSSANSSARKRSTRRTK